MSERLTVALEGTGKRIFAAALEWPGWARSGKTFDGVVQTLLAYAPRYEPVVRAAGLTLGTSFDVEVIEQLEGGSGTEFGVLSRPTESDSRPTNRAEGGRLASIVAASWAEFAREMGIRERHSATGDRTAVEALRAAMLGILREPSDGSPLADRKRPVRYAARRIAWHALDHAWEIEDRSE